MNRPAVKAFGRKTASGFSMIEVLIAMVVLAVGLLGFALLQTSVLRYTQSSNYRTQATNLAYDLLDQIRANRVQVAQYTAITAKSFDKVTGANCARSMKEFVSVTENMQRWRCQVRAVLGPDAWAAVSIQTNGNLAVVISWADARNEVANSESDDAYGQVKVVTLL